MCQALSSEVLRDDEPTAPDECGRDVRKRLGGTVVKQLLSRSQPYMRKWGEGRPSVWAEQSKAEDAGGK